MAAFLPKCRINSAVVDTAKDTWQNPDIGVLKLNVDGSYCYETAEAGTGGVLRDSDDRCVFATCQSLRSCNNPLDAELTACEEGIRLALQFSTMPFTVEMDSYEVLALVDPAKPNLSKYCNSVDAIRRLLQEREGVKMIKCSRSQNNVSHTLANFARINASSEFWLGEKPQFVIDALRQDSVQLFD